MNIVKTQDEVKEHIDKIGEDVSVLAQEYIDFQIQIEQLMAEIAIRQVKQADIAEEIESLIGHTPFIVDGAEGQSIFVNIGKTGTPQIRSYPHL